MDWKVLIVILTLACAAANLCGAEPVLPCSTVEPPKNSTDLETIFGTEREGLLCDAKPCITARWYQMQAACTPVNVSRWVWPGAHAPGGGSDALPQLLSRHWRNRTVIVSGDSITDEAFAAILCELRAQGLEVNDFDFRGWWNNGDDALRRAAEADGVHPDERALIERVLQVPREAWLPPRDSMAVPLMGARVGETGTLLVRKLAFKVYPDDVIAQMGVGDVIIAAYGLHYGLNMHIGPSQNCRGGSGNCANLTETPFGAGMATLFDLASNSSVWGGELLVKEGSAQHFPGTGSFESWSQARPQDACACEAMGANAAETNGMRWQHEHLLAMQLQHPAVKVLPFYDATAERAEMHLGERCTVWLEEDDEDVDATVPPAASAAGGAASGEGGAAEKALPEKRRLKHMGRTEMKRSCNCDCTHYCYEPAFWSGVFDAWLRRLAATSAESTAAAAAAAANIAASMAVGAAEAAEEAVANEAAAAVEAAEREADKMRVPGL